MDNSAIASKFSQLAKLMDIHGENSFKIKNYSNAAYQIERLETAFKEMQPAQISSVKGIGEATAKKIIELLQTGRLTALEQYIENTPAGVYEMLNIKGIGAKKINIIWKEMEIETVGELLYACNENRLTRYKGFGQKTQQNVKESIEFYVSKLGFFLYRDAIPFVGTLLQLLTKKFPDDHFFVAGDFRRQLETIEALEFVTDADAVSLRTFIEAQAGIHYAGDDAEWQKYHMENGPAFTIYFTQSAGIGTKLFQKTGSQAFLDAFSKKFFGGQLPETNNEINLFENAGISYIEPYLREDELIIERAVNKSIPQAIKTEDIKGIIHSHSTWSDGEYTLEQMAKAAIDNGFEYLVITDHSRSAGYAEGLHIEKVLLQHQEIEWLNKQLAPFKIFKSIESDILNDGSLDYPDDILNRFDLVIASIHSNLKMPANKATARLLKAIENPYTTILGHMTGRLLLSRPGYPVDYKTIIDACAANRVVIELNANPRRLDMDWRWLRYTEEKNVLISINPDAHFIEKFADVHYGVLAAQKGLLTANRNLSSFSLPQFEAYIRQRKEWSLDRV
jgi:DNA polymerase (family 10)